MIMSRHNIDNKDRQTAVMVLIWHSAAARTTGGYRLYYLNSVGYVASKCQYKRG
jgi:hypothetical protein